MFGIGDATPQSPTRKISYSRLRELSTYLVDLTMAGSNELKHEVFAGFLAMGIEAIKNNEKVREMSLQQAATQFVTAWVEVTTNLQHEVFPQESNSGNNSELSLSQAHGTGVLPPTRHTQNPTGKARKRFRSFVEITRERHNNRKKKERRECSFCGGWDHNIARCDKKLSLGLLVSNYSDREEVNRKLTLREEEPTHSLDKVELSSVKFRLPNEVKSLKILGIGKVSTQS